MSGHKDTEACEWRKSVGKTKPRRKVQIEPFTPSQGPKPKSVGIEEIFMDLVRSQTVISNDNSTLPLDLGHLELHWRWDWRTGVRLGPTIVKFLDGGSSAQFHPNYALGTAAIRGELQLDHQTMACWEVQVDEVYGSSMMFGIGTENALLSVPFDFTNLLGGFSTPNTRNQLESCGLSHKGFYFNGISATQFCEPFPEGVGCRVGVLFDGPANKLGFSINGKWMGWAPHTLDFDSHADDGQKRVFFPMVSSTAQRSCFTLLPNSQHKTRMAGSLQKLCQEAIVGQLMANNKLLGMTGPEFEGKIRKEIKLPKDLQNALCELLCSRRASFASAKMDGGGTVEERTTAQKMASGKGSQIMRQRKRKLACPQHYKMDKHVS